MSCINNYYKNFECDTRTTRLVEQILEEYKPLLRWIKNRQNRWGDDFKEDLYQYTLYNLTVNTWNRVNKHKMSDEEILKYAPMSIYRAYADSVKNMPVNIREIREYPHSIEEDYNETGRMEPGHVLVPTSTDDKLERSGEPELEDLIDSLPCDDSLKTAILMMAQGYKQIDAVLALNIPRNTLSKRLKAFRNSVKFKEWAKLNDVNI